jgi:hypothetical protein
MKNYLILNRRIAYVQIYNTKNNRGYKLLASKLIRGCQLNCSLTKSTHCALNTRRCQLAVHTSSGRNIAYRWCGKVLQPSQKARERAAKQNKVTVLVLGTVDVAFNTSVCCCCYASQWTWLSTLVYVAAAMLLSGRASCLLLLVEA